MEEDKTLDDKLKELKASRDALQEKFAEISSIVDTDSMIYREAKKAFADVIEVLDEKKEILEEAKEFQEKVWG